MISVNGPHLPVRGKRTGGGKAVTSGPAAVLDQRRHRCPPQVPRQGRLTQVGHSTAGKETAKAPKVSVAKTPAYEGREGSDEAVAEDDLGVLWSGFEGFEGEEG